MQKHIKNYVLTNDYMSIKEKLYSMDNNYSYYDKLEFLKYREKTIDTSNIITSDIVKQNKIDIEMSNLNDMKMFNILPSSFLNKFEGNKVTMSIYYEENRLRCYVIEYYGKKLRYLESEFNKKLSKINILGFNIK